MTTNYRVATKTKSVHKQSWPAQAKLAIIRERHKKSGQNTDERQGVKQHKQAEKQISRPSHRFDRVSTQSAHGHRGRNHTEQSQRVTAQGQRVGT